MSLSIHDRVLHMDGHHSFVDCCNFYLSNGVYYTVDHAVQLPQNRFSVILHEEQLSCFVSCAIKATYLLVIPYIIAQIGLRIGRYLYDYRIREVEDNPPMFPQPIVVIPINPPDAQPNNPYQVEEGGPPFQPEHIQHNEEDPGIEINEGAAQPVSLDSSSNEGPSPGERIEGEESPANQISSFAPSINRVATATLNMGEIEQKEEAEKKYADEPQGEIPQIFPVSLTKVGQVVTKEQILSICRFILGEIGKQEDSDVRQRFFPKHIEKLEALIKRIGLAERLRLGEIQQELIDILSMELNYSEQHQTIERDKRDAAVHGDWYSAYREWHLEFTQQYLWEQMHPLALLNISPEFLPEAWKDLLSQAKEKYLFNHLVKAESFLGTLVPHLDLERINLNITNKSLQYGFYDFIEKQLLGKIAEKERGPIAFACLIGKKEYQKAWEYCGDQIAQLSHGHRGELGRVFSYTEEFGMKVVWEIVIEKGELEALNFLLHKVPKGTLIHEDGDDSLVLFGRSEWKHQNYRFVALNTLLFYVIRNRGLGNAIKFVETIPYPLERAILVNHLIYRLTQAENYAMRWDLTYEKVVRDGPFANDSSKQKYKLKAEDLPEDIERAIELFKRFPTGKLEHWFDEKFTSLRSAYIIEALLRKGDQKQAKAFLPSFRISKTGLDFKPYRYQILLGGYEFTHSAIFDTVAKFEKSQR